MTPTRSGSSAGSASTASRNAATSSASTVPPAPRTARACACPYPGEPGEQPPPAGRDGDQLTRGAVVPDRGDDDPAGRGQPVHGERPVDQRLRRPAVQG